MEDFLPTIIVVSSSALLLLAGVFIYAGFFWFGWPASFFIVLSFVSVLVASAIYWLAPNIDNKDAILAIKQVVGVIWLFNFLLLFSNLVSVFAFQR